MCEFHGSNGNGFGDIWWTDNPIYFSSIDIGQKLSNDIPTNSVDPLSYIKSAVPESIFVDSVDESEIYKHL